MHAKIGSRPLLGGDNIIAVEQKLGGAENWALAYQRAVAPSVAVLAADRACLNCARPPGP
jgi:hypothetical protein